MKLKVSKPNIFTLRVILIHENADEETALWSLVSALNGLDSVRNDIRRGNKLEEVELNIPINGEKFERQEVFGSK